MTFLQKHGKRLREFAVIDGGASADVVAAEAESLAQLRQAASTTHGWADYSVADAAEGMAEIIAAYAAASVAEQEAADEQVAAWAAEAEREELLSLLVEREEEEALEDLRSSWEERPAHDVWEAVVGEQSCEDFWDNSQKSWQEVGKYAAHAAAEFDLEGVEDIIYEKLCLCIEGHLEEREASRRLVWWEPQEITDGTGACCILVGQVRRNETEEDALERVEAQLIEDDLWEGLRHDGGLVVCPWEEGDEWIEE
jgi:hypothetical protein